MNTITEEQFKNYLESIGGLNRTYREERGSITNPKSFGVNSGWYGLLQNLIQELIVAGWDKKLNQSKEKFGGLCFYVENYNTEIREIINKYERMSHIICEDCGEPGKLVQTGWWRTLCEKHEKERQDKLDFLNNSNEEE